MNIPMPCFVLDACALIAFLNDEEGAGRVEARFIEAIDGRASVFVTAINICEVYYDCLRMKGEDEADQLLEQIEGLPVVILRTVDDSLLKTAGRLKAEERISLADAFALGASVLIGARVLTSDHHEFDSIAAKGEVAFEWIR